MSDYARRVAELRERDPNLEIFGASSHRWQFAPPLDENTVAKLEDDFAIDLPADYRQFITTVGNGGAGPGYGLLPLNHLAGAFPVSHAWNPDMSQPGIDKSTVEGMGGYEADVWVEGTAALADLGCGLTSILVVAGDESVAGKVFIDARAAQMGLHPICNSFDEWYQRWLGKADDRQFGQCPVGRDRCAFFQAIDGFLGSVAQGRKLDDAEERAAFDQIGDGGIAARKGQGDRNFDEGQVLRLCQCCDYFSRWLMGRGVLSPSKIAPGTPHKLQR